jgi:hypothetical protein
VATQPAQFMPPIERRTARAFVFMAAIVTLRRVVSRYQREAKGLFPSLRIRSASLWLALLPLHEAVISAEIQHIIRSLLAATHGSRDLLQTDFTGHQFLRRIFRFIEHNQILHVWIIVW